MSAPRAGSSFDAQRSRCASLKVGAIGRWERTNMAGHAKSIPADATIKVIRSRLRDPERYLRGVLGKMLLCKREHGSAIVRIGTTGEGRAPHYRVEPAEGLVGSVEKEILADTPEDSAHEAARREIAFYNAYHGVSHNKLEWGSKQLREYSWSARSMSIGDVQQLLGEVRRLK